MVVGSFPGVERPRSGVEHPPLSSPKVEGRVELYIYSRLGLRGLLQGELYLYLFILIRFKIEFLKLEIS
jgi:hypothetical protein